MLAQEYPITQIGEVLEVARSTYYHRRVPLDEQGADPWTELTARANWRHG